MWYVTDQFPRPLQKKFLITWYKLIFQMNTRTNKDNEWNKGITGSGDFKV